MNLGRRLLALVALVALLGLAVGASVVLPATAAGAVPISPACPGTTAGATFTLTANCDTTAPLEVLNGFTVDGAGFTITAHDPVGGVFDGAVLTNASGATSMNVQNLTIRGTGFAGGGILHGILFNGAAGSVSNVVVQDMTANSGSQLGRSIVANATSGSPQTVTITGTTVRGYQKSGLIATGPMTMNVSASTIGPPDDLASLIAQNGVTYFGGAGGSLTASTIHGSGFTGSPPTTGTAVLLLATTNVIVSGNTIVGAGTDTGVFVGDNSTGVTIENNQITRSSANTPDNFGVGVNVEAGSTATLTCNTFSGWLDNLGGVATQAPCITTTTPLPGGTIGSPYSATLAGHTPNPPVTWSASGLPPGLTLAPTGSISGTPTAAGTFSFTATLTDSTGATATRQLSITIAPAPPPGPCPAAVPGAGYRLVAADGGIFSFGNQEFCGSTGAMRLNQPVVGMASTPTGNGYWLVARDGGIFSFGHAVFHGSTGAMRLNEPIVGMASTPTGNGYWLVARDGGIFSFGDAVFHGSTGAMRLNEPIVGMASTPTGNGYWLVAADGGIFSFGNAVFHGSTGAMRLNQPIVGMASTPTGNGYWLVARDGGIFSFGDAVFHGSTGAMRLNQPIVGMQSTPNGGGYWLVARDGGIFSFGDAVFHGSTGAIRLNEPIVGMD